MTGESTEIRGEVTQILDAAAGGDRGAIDQLFEILYPELRDIARRNVRSIQGESMLDTTSVVHESYLRLIKQGKVSANNRRHFLGYASHVMRSVVIDFVRQARSQRRGGDRARITLNTNLAESLAGPEEEVVRLNDLLEELAGIDARLVQVVEMRYFAALDYDEIAQCLGITSRTVRRDLEKVRLLLLDSQA